MSDARTIGSTPLAVNTPTDVVSDATLVNAVRAGHRHVFGDLYVRHATAVRRVLSDNVHDAERRQELVQETFARALAKIDDLHDPGRFRPWVFQIARNLAIDDLRSRSRLPTSTIDDTDESSLADITAEDPEITAEVNELAAAIQNGIARLSERDAAAVSMVAHLGFGPHEVAAALGISYANAKVVLHRARARLRATLTETPDAHHGRGDAGRRIHHVCPVDTPRRAPRVHQVAPPHRFHPRPVAGSHPSSIPDRLFRDRRSERRGDG